MDISSVFLHADYRYILAGLVFGFILRLPLFYLYQDSDRWGVYTKLKWMKKRKWISYEVPDSFIKGIFPYPMMTYFFVSRFPEGWWRKASLILSIVPDLIVSVSVYMASLHLLNDDFGLSERNIFSFLLMLIYLTLPVLFPQTARLKATNGRTPGMLFVTIYFVAMAIFIEGGHWAWLICSLAMAVLTCLTSLFAAQEMVFISLLLALFYLSPVPLLLLAAVAVIAFLFPSVGIRDIILFKINHHIFYRKFEERGITNLGRNLFGNFFKFFYYLFKDKFKSLEILLKRSPLLIASYSILPVWLLVYALLEIEGIRALLLSTPVWRFAAFLFFANLLVFFITSTKRWSVLGEAERYFEYAAPALVIISVIPLLNRRLISLPFLTALVMVQLCVIILLHFSLHLRELKSQNLQGMEEIKLSGFLSGIPGKLRVATLPVKLPILLSAYTHTSLASENPVLYYYRFMFDIEKKFKAFDYYMNDVATIDIFKVAPEELQQKYGVNCIVVDKRYFIHTGYPFVSAVKGMKPVYSSQRYNVYLLDRKQASPVKEQIEDNVSILPGILSEYVRFTYNYASHLKANQETAQAEKVFRSILHAPLDGIDEGILGGVFFHLGEIAMKRKEYTDAYHCFARCVNFIPQHRKANGYLAQLKEEVGDD